MCRIKSRNKKLGNKDNLKKKMFPWNSCEWIVILGQYDVFLG